MVCSLQSYIFAGDPTNGGAPPTGCCSREWTGPVPGTIGSETGGHFARILQPCGGGGCHPVLDILSVNNGQETPVAVLEGPMFMKGTATTDIVLLGGLSLISHLFLTDLSALCHPTRAV